MPTNYFYGPFLAGRTAVALLLMRFVCGLGLALHGWEKTRHGHGFHWGDDLHIPSFFQGLAMFSELGGGLALILGLLTPWASLGIVCTMIYAIGSFHLTRGHPFVNMEGGGSWELNALYLVIPLGLILCGPGRVSLDWWLFGKNKELKQTA